MVHVAGDARSSPGLVAPLSFAQQRMWLLDQLIPAAGVYNVPALFEVRGLLDVPLLKDCLHALMKRHLPLRTGVTATSGEPFQTISAPDALAAPLTWHDLRNLTQRQRQLRGAELVTAAARTRFDLDQPPLWRAELMTEKDDRHLMMLVFHHIAVDGSSLAIFMDELASLYRAGRGAPDPLPPLPISYTDFAQAQREAMSGRAATELMAYWRERLRDAPQLLQLPTDRSRPAESTFGGGAVEITVPTTIQQGLRDLATRLRTTPFVVLLAIFSNLMHRYTGRADFLVGTPVSGRTCPEWEPLVGCFVNTLVLRADVTGEPRFVDLVSRTKATVLSALDHQELPFELLVTELAPTRVVTHHPLCQVLFALTRMDAVWTTADLSIRELPPVWNGTAKLDLALTWYEKPAELSGALQYATDLIDRSTAERMVGHLLTLTRSAIADPTELVTRQELLPRAERDRILARSRGPRGNLRDPVRPVHLCVADQAERRPDALALSDGRRRLTYRALVCEAARLAGLLRAAGAGPETPVALCLPRGVDLVVAELAAMTTGAAFLPMEPASPASRLSRLLDEARPCAVVTTSAHREKLPDAFPAVLDLDALDPPAWAPAPVPQAEVDVDGLAYIIYTSGSTGAPKGVMISHRSLANLAAWYADVARLTGDDRCTSMSQPAFDASVLETWPGLAVGASLHFLPESATGSPAQVQAWVLAEEITVAFMVTALGESVMRLRWPPGTPMRSLHVGGERLNHSPDPQLPFQVRNLYGPTECTVVASDTLVRPGDDPPLVGRPLPGTETYVLDARMRPTPPGVPGELYLGGAGLARGYVARPDLTADRFVPHPWQVGRRLYRTGDVVRWRGDQLDFVGRTDHQIKIHGYRIEPGEIESVLIGHPAVTEALVSNKGGRLAAHVAATTTVTPAELRNYLVERLPNYLVPVDYAIAGKLPRNASGKVDMDRLPRPAPATEATYEQPRTDLERRIARVWQEVLGIDRVGIHDRFFALGGNSLLLAQVHARLAAVGATDVPLVVLYEYQTVAGLGRKLEELASGSSADRQRTAPAAINAGAQAAQARVARLRELRRPSPDRRI